MRTRVHPADGLAGGERQADDEVLGALDQAMGTAAGRNDAEVIRLLVVHGGSVDTVDERGWTPLNVAGRLGHASAVRALLEAGAPADATGQKGETALHLACLSPSAPSVQALLAAGASPHLA